MTGAPRTAIVLTGVGLDGGPDIIRALRADPALGARIVGVDVSADQPGRHLADAFHLVPRRDDPGYVDAVAAVAESEGARVIFPLPTFDQELFSAARDELAAKGIAVPVSSPEAVRVCNDKWLLHERLTAALPAVLPERRLVGSVEEVAEGVRALGYPDRRVCLRARVSRGAIGFRVLDAGPDRLRALLHDNPGSPGSLLVSLDELLSVLGQAESFPDGLMVEEYLPGDEWDVDVLARAGEPLVVATRRNVAMRGGGATRSVLERHDEVAALTAAIVAELRLDAVVNVSFRLDADGTPKLLEINPRVPSSILTALGGGINLVALAVRQALGEQLSAAEPAWGAEFLLYSQSVVTDPGGRAVLAR